MENFATSGTDDLLLRAAGGDTRARCAVLDRHRERLRRMIAVRLDKRVLARVDPSDVLQEALVEADAKLSDYLQRRPVPFYPWLRRLAWENLVRLHNQHLNAKRRTVQREECSITGLPDESASYLVDRLIDSGPAPEQRLVRVEIKSRLLLALAELSENDRELLILRYLEQLSNSEIASILQISEGAVRTRHTRALDRLSRCMGEE